MNSVHLAKNTEKVNDTIQCYRNSETETSFDAFTLAEVNETQVRNSVNVTKSNAKRNQPTNAQTMFTVLPNKFNTDNKVISNGWDIS